MICPKCDKENDPTSKFCGICGTTLQSYEPYSAVEAPMVSFPQAVKRGIRNILKFRGRATRAEYWWFILFLTLVGFIPFVGWFIYGIGHITVLIRRLHDVGKSGWWYLAPFAPFPLFILSEYFGWITLALFTYLLYLTLLQGEFEKNKHGPNPRLVPISPQDPNIPNSYSQREVE